MIQLADSPLNTVREYASLPRQELVERIHRQKAALNAVILGHNYQLLEIQEVSDFLGDSLGLSQEAANTDADVIVFCGVHFMAETAKILSPHKTVLMPDPGAGCPMADFVTAESLRERKAQHPDALVVTYVNSSADVKAESDICCTSANAVEVVASLPADRPVLFVPDRNLAQWVTHQTGRDNIIPWDGYCYVHDDMVMEELRRAKEAHPDALVVIHPEARQDLLDQADAVASTSGMVKMAAEHDALIIGTERGLVEKLQEDYPEKTMVCLSGAAICGNMKANNLPKLAWSLDHLQFEVTMPEEIRIRAEKALQRMLEVSSGWRGRGNEKEGGIEAAGVSTRGCGCG